jgi:hypothetical protein
MRLTRIEINSPASEGKKKNCIIIKVLRDCVIAQFLGFKMIDIAL